MAKPNYNLIKFIRRNIYQMKREYGGAIQINILGAIDTDLKTGVKSATYTSYDIKRAVVLPVRYKREVIQTISMISANKKFVQGGLFETGTRSFIIDRRDCPTLTAIHNEDWIVYSGKRYEIKWIDEFEQGTAWLIIGKELEGAQKNEVHSESPSSDLTVTDTASATVGGWVAGVATSSMSLGSTASAVKDIVASASSNLGLTVNAAGVAAPSYIEAFTINSPSVLISPEVVKVGGPATGWQWGDGNTGTGNSTTHTYTSNGNYTINFNAAVSTITEFAVNGDEVTSINVNADWTNLEDLRTYANLLTTQPTFASWTNLINIFAYQNPSMTGFVAHSAWASIVRVYVDTCDLSAATIDAILIALDATGQSNGFLRYQNNPGSPDGSRSGPAATAKANLISNGWTVTIS